MSHIQIERQHTLGLPAARQHAQTWAEKATAKFGVQCRYEAGDTQDVLHFDGNGMQGQLHVSATALKLDAELGFLAAMFQDKIEAKLNAQFDAMVQAG
ncbi:MAG: polyhydroxyalkanoic acid system family protein [Comamonas sp.]